MTLQPTHIQTNDRMDILAGEWKIHCAFKLETFHTVLFQYTAPVVSFFYTMQLTIDDSRVYDERLYFPAIRSDERVFYVEGLPCIFSYQFGIFGRKIRLIVDGKTILSVDRGL
jgi:hypothetical protein